MGSKARSCTRHHHVYESWNSSRAVDLELRVSSPQHSNPLIRKQSEVGPRTLGARTMPRHGSETHRDDSKRHFETTRRTRSTLCLHLWSLVGRKIYLGNILCVLYMALAKAFPILPCGPRCFAMPAQAKSMLCTLLPLLNKQEVHRSIRDDDECTCKDRESNHIRPHGKIVEPKSAQYAGTRNLNVESVAVILES